MEPQAAVAMPDEGGAMLVHSSTQCIDMIQTAVAAALNLPYNQVIARAPPAAPTRRAVKSAAKFWCSVSLLDPPHSPVTARAVRHLLLLDPPVLGVPACSAGTFTGCLLGYGMRVRKPLGLSSLAWCGIADEQEPCIMGLALTAGVCE